MSGLHKSNKYKMNKSTASDTLQNVFATVGEPVPNKMNTIISKQVNIPRKTNTVLVLCIALLIVTLLLPLAFSPFVKKGTINPKANVTISSYYVDGNVFFVDLNGSFINDNSIYAISSSGERFEPKSYNIWDDSFYFDYDGTEWNIYVDDIYGNTIHMLLSPPRQ